MNNDNSTQSKSFPFMNPSLDLNTRISDLISRLTLSEKISLLPTSEAAVDRLNIKSYGVGGEAAHGISIPKDPATIFPQPIGLSCTWNPDLMKKIGSVVGDEARIYYDKYNRKEGLTRWAPTIDMERDPRWGRTEEAYGEDPCLTGKLSSELIKGMQGDHAFYLKFVPAPKHFYANNVELGRTWLSSSITPRTKHEYYLKAFKPAFVEGKANSMMTAYNSINGVPCIVNPEVQSIVKDSWGCDGFIVCDGGDMSQTVEHHKYYSSHAETIANALKAGIDCFTDDVDLVIKSTEEALERNLITESDINRALTNIFKIRFRLGQFDPDELNPYSNIPKEKLCSKEHNDLALTAAEEAIVLLKNENNILPLNKDKINKIAVLGPLADALPKGWYSGNVPYKITTLDGIKEKLCNKEVVYHSGNDTVALLCDENKRYLCLSGDDSETISCSEEKVTLANKFEVCDWGYNSFTFRNKVNNKYLTTDDLTISSSSKDIWGWFLKQSFKIHDFYSDKFKINTWNGGHVQIENTSGILHVTESYAHNTVNFKDEITFKKEVLDDGIAEAVKLAKSSDVAVVVVGNHPLINAKEEIDRPDINLPLYQEKLIKAVYAANPKTIVIVIGSYPFAINWINDNIPAILYTAHGCQELGHALANCIFGDYSPAGRLSMTWYKNLDTMPDINDYDIINGKRTYMYFEGDPLYPFGYGLTYSDFKYSDLTIEKNSIGLNDKIKVDFKLTNIGTIESDEVPQMYVHVSSTKIKRANKQLVDFKRINLTPMESTTISFTLNSDDLMFWSEEKNDFSLEKCSFEVMIGRSSDDIKLKQCVGVQY